jgi:hypothetical protein
MKKLITMSLLGSILCVSAVRASDSLDAAIGGAVGGGLGAFVGSEIGGREGAIIGGAVGGAAGAAVATDGHRAVRPEPYYRPVPVYRAPVYRAPVYREPIYHRHPRSFCPPGQAKKGRCW